MESFAPSLKAHDFIQGLYQVFCLRFQDVYRDCTCKLSIFLKFVVRDIQGLLIAVKMP